MRKFRPAELTGAEAISLVAHSSLQADDLPGTEAGGAHGSGHDSSPNWLPAWAVCMGLNHAGVAVWRAGHDVLRWRRAREVCWREKPGLLELVLLKFTV